MIITMLTFSGQNYPQRLTARRPRNTWMHGGKRKPKRHLNLSMSKYRTPNIFPQNRPSFFFFAEVFLTTLSNDSFLSVAQAKHSISSWILNFLSHPTSSPPRNLVILPSKYIQNPMTFHHFCGFDPQSKLLFSPP